MDRALTWILLLMSSILLPACAPTTTTETCQIPSYNPTYWNNDFDRLKSNNCYNYANNVATGTHAQPGRSGNYSPTTNSCDEYTTAAEADGIMTVDRFEDCPDEECRLALVIAPGEIYPGSPVPFDPKIHGDYHWYRMDFNSFWSHKPGQTPATDSDESGFAISNPETADRAGTLVNYTDFCGYFCSCSSSEEGAGHENIR